MLIANQLLFFLPWQITLATSEGYNHNGTTQTEAQCEGGVYLLEDEIENAVVDLSTPDNQCTFYYPKVSMISWVPEEQIVHTSDVTVGIISTLVFLYNASIIAVETQTDYNEATALHSTTPPRLTADMNGTTVAVAAFENADPATVLQLEYPNVYIDYGMEYSWEGVLETIANNSSVYWASATAGPSTVLITDHSAIPRSWYPEPTQTDSIALDHYGRPLQPIWVSVDVVGDMASMMDRRFNNVGEGAFDQCNRTTIPSGLATPTFYTTRPVFDQVTAMIPMTVAAIVTGIQQNTTRTGPPYGNGTRTEALVFETANLTITLTGDRSGMFQRSTKGWEQTTGGTDEDVQPFTMILTDWELPSAPPEPQVTPNYRKPDASEAEVIANYLNSLSVLIDHDQTVDRTPSIPVITNQPSPPQRTPPPDEVGVDQGPIDGDAIAHYFAEHSGAPSDPESGGDLRIAPIWGIKNAHTVADVQAMQVIPDAEPTLTASTARDLLLTSVLTTSNGIPTTALVYIIPDLSIVPAGQELTLNGRTTPLSIPDLLPTHIPTIIDGVFTSTLAYIVRGHSIATIGQTITLDGQSTVLDLPSVVFAQIATSVNGRATDVPLFIVEGSSTASIGQEIILGGTPTVLAAPDPIPTLVLDTIDGLAKPSLAFVVGESLIATIGQTLTWNGEVTVLSEPTGPVVMEGGAMGGLAVLRNITFIGLGTVLVLLSWSA